jgi:N-acetylglucosaminyldiphosphoundecaprenol N-acetyl-beta-D-mannosaminyltransferase
MLDNRPVWIKGVRIDGLSSDEIVARLPVILKKRVRTHIVTLNAPMFYDCQRHKQIRNLVNSAELVTPDGAGILWAGRLFGHRFKERVAGFDLFKRFLQYANEHRATVFLLGGRSQMMDKLVPVIRRTWKNVRIVGRHHGFFDPAREKEIVESVRKIRPDFLFVAMGAFRQEIFIHNHREAVEVPVMMGVGGSFDVLAGYRPRAPRWLQAVGLEWLFRFLTEPRRLPQIAKIPLFMAELVWHRLFAGGRQ